MARFVLLYHDCPDDVPRPSHCDLMLESGGCLRTWVLAELPREWAVVVSRLPERVASLPMVADDSMVAAEPLGDHRLAYLDYEGPVSGNRGSVRRLDRGTFETIDQTPSGWEVALAGGLLRGRVSLRRPTDDELR